MKGISLKRFGPMGMRSRKSDLATIAGLPLPLERVLGPRMAGELGIEDLITPFPERRGPVDALQEIGDPMPVVAQENGLIDIFRAATHRRCGCFSGK